MEKIKIKDVIYFIAGLIIGAAVMFGVVWSLTEVTTTTIEIDTDDAAQIPAIIESLNLYTEV